MNAVISTKQPILADLWKTHLFFQGFCIMSIISQECTKTIFSCFGRCLLETFPALQGAEIFVLQKYHI